MLIKETGGLDGVHDDSLLESALQVPFQTFAGEELYPNIQKKAACYRRYWTRRFERMDSVSLLEWVL